MGFYRDARERMAGQLAQRLQKAGHPRVQMALMVSATGSAGFLMDWLMLKAGLARMALRYAAAVGLAYLVFLLLIKVWLVFHRRRQAAAAQSSSSSRGSDWGFSSAGGSSAPGSSGDSFQGGGGSSGGGGASASFDDPVQAPVMAGSTGSGSGFSGGGGGGGSVDLDGDELMAIVLLLMAIAAAAAAAVYLVVQAPAIFGEVLLDGTLSAGLYKRLRDLEHRSWLETALRKTVLPFAAVALLAGIAGHYAQKAAPEARSIGGVWRHFTV